MTETTKTETFVARSAIRRVVRKEVYSDELAEIIGKAIATSVGELRTEIVQRIAKLEERIAEFTFKGQWQEGMAYKRGNFVAMGGQLYHCENHTASRPGSDNNWTIAVKSGRDGRDGRDAPAQAELPQRRTVTSHR